MTRSARARVPLLLPLLSALVVLVVAGCGGGGGGGNGGASLFGRSFSTATADREVTFTIDRLGRMTIYARDTTALPNGAWAQGVMGTDGRFAVQNSGGILFTGTVTAGGASASGSVSQGAGKLFDFSAALVPPGRATTGISGTYSNDGAVKAFLSIDVTGHGTLFAQVNTTAWGGLIAISDTGAFESADGSGATTGQITPSGADIVLRIDKLNGVTVNTTVTLSPLTRAKWTFLVFLNAANNLDEFGPLNVNQMEEVGSTSDVNMVVQWKRANCGDCGNPEWVGTRRYFITKDSNETQVTSQLVQDMGQNIDMGDWRELRNFIVWGQQRYPADRYALVIWNHGAGWRSTRAGDRTPPVFRAVSIDDSTNNEIDTWQLSSVLGDNQVQRLAMVIFDASLMQMMEVAYEMKDYTDVIVGSEESPPGEGYVYDAFLRELVANPGMTPAQFGASIVHRTLDAYGRNTNLTQSALDTSRLVNLAAKIDTFADTLEANINTSSAAMVFARQNAENYAYPENKDLWHYAELIKQNTTVTALKNAAADVQTAIGTALIAEDHGSINGNSHGVAIYVPAPINYLTNYANLAFARNTDWDRWLQNQPNQ